MSKHKYGITAFQVAAITAVTGLPLLDGSEIDIKPEIYRDTFDMTEEDGTTTTHYTEMENTPFLEFEEPGKETLSFDLVNTEPARLLQFLGGTVVTAGGKTTWTKPANQGALEKYLTITLIDGTIMVIPRAKIVTKKNFTFRRNEPWRLSVKATVLQPELGGLPPMTISEPE